MNAIRFRATILTVLLGASAAALMLADAAPCHAAVSGAMGRVFEVDQNGRLVRPVPNAAIEIRNLAQQPVASAVSDPNGYYQVQLPPGQYRYKVQADGFRVEDHGRGFIVERPDRYDLVDLTLTRAAGPPDPQPWIPDVTPDPQPEPQPEPDLIITAGDLTGQVYWMHGDRREGISGAQITLRRVGERRRGVPAYSGLGGRYQTQLAVGAWRATVNARGFQMLIDPKDIEITGGTVTRDFELKPLEEPTPEGQGIEGYVRVMSEPHPHRAVLDPRALPPADPPADLNIFIYRRGTRTRIGPVPHNSHGDYRQPLEPADYQVEARAEGFKTARSDWTTVFPGRFERVNLVLQPEESDGHQGILDVTVVDHPSQEPLTGIEFQVRARKPGQALSEAVSGKTIDGVAHLTPLDLAKYEVFALPAEGYELVEKKEIDIQAGANRITLQMRKQAMPDDGPLPSDLDPVGLFGYVTWKDPTSQTGYRGVQGVTLHWEWINEPKAIDVWIIVLPNQDEQTDSDNTVEPLKAHFAGWWTTQMGATKDYRLHVSTDLSAATATGTYKASANTVGVLQGKLSDGGRRWEGHWTEGKPSEEDPTMPAGEPGGRFRAVMTAANTDAFSGCYNHDANKPLKDCSNYGMSQIRATRTAPPEGGKFSVTTDAQGRFPLGGKVVTAPSGWYRVTFAEIPGEFLPKEPATVLVDSEHVQQYFILEKKPDERVTVRGTISDAHTRRLLDGAKVTWHVQRRDGGITQYTAQAPDGRYAIELAPGNYRARAEHVGYTPTDRGISIQVGKRNTEDFALEPLAHPTPHPQPVPDHTVSLVIDVLGADPHGRAAPLSGVRVDIGYRGRVRAWGHTDIRGQWEESLPPADRIDVKLSKPGYDTQTDSFPLQGRGVRKRYVLQPTHVPHPQPHPQPHPHPQPNPSGNHPVTLRITHERGMAIFAQVEIKRGAEVVAKGGARDGTFQTRLPNAAYTVTVRWRGLTAPDEFTVRAGPVNRKIELHGKPTGYISPGPRGRR